MSLPLLYSFRRCPYAIRARLALLCSELPYHVQEVSLKEKPPQMLAISPKGTVPVMQLADGTVLEESIEIALWALQTHDPSNYVPSEDQYKASMALIEKNDSEFKHWLDRYKYADRHPEHSQEYYRCNAEKFLTELDNLLTDSKYLQGNKPNLTDIAILPFVRQFAAVDRSWFDASQYVDLRRWLECWLSSKSFMVTMEKKPKSAQV